MTSADLAERVHQTLSRLNEDTAEGQHADIIAAALEEDFDDVQAALDQLVATGRARTATVYGALNRPRVESSDLVDEIARQLADMFGSRAFSREHLGKNRTHYRAAARAAIDYIENAA